MQILKPAVLLTVVLSTAVHADVPSDPFVDGLNFMANGKFDQALNCFDKVLAADPKLEACQVDRAVSLIMLGKTVEAQQALRSAWNLNHDNIDVEVWSYAWMYVLKPRGLAQGEVVPERRTSYSLDLLSDARLYAETPADNTIGRNNFMVVIKSIASKFGEDQIASARSGDLEQEVIRLCSAGQYQQCLDLIDRSRGQVPLSGTVLGETAVCRFQLGDISGARTEYTECLRLSPMELNAWIGRAQCEIRMGSLRDAEADLALVKFLDVRGSEAYLAQSQADLADARAKTATESPADLLASLKAAVAAGKSDADLAAIGTRLARARWSRWHDVSEEYTREYLRLQLAVNHDPQNVDVLVAFAKFLIEPTFEMKAIVDGAETAVRVRCGEGNRTRAWDFLSAAAAINPKNAGLCEQMAIYYADADPPDNTGQSWANAAVDAGALDIRLARVCIDYAAGNARQELGSAGSLRSGWSRMSWHDQGNQRITETVTHRANDGELAQAGNLEQQASQGISQAQNLVTRIIANTQNATDPASQATFQMATAMDQTYQQHFDLAIAAAESALKINPYDDQNALPFLINFYRVMGRQDLQTQLQEKLDNLTNPSVAQTLATFEADLRAIQIPDAITVLEQAETIDPTSVDNAVARFDLAVAQQRLDDAKNASRLVDAFAAGQLQLVGQALDPSASGSIHIGQVQAAVDVQLRLARLLDTGGDTNDALGEYGHAFAIMKQVPDAEYIQQIYADGRITGQLDNRPKDPLESFDVSLCLAHKWVLGKLMAAGDYGGALDQLVVLLHSGLRDEQLEPTGYQIFQKLGWDAMKDKIPGGWRQQFGLPPEEIHDGSPRDLELQQIEKRMAEINQQMVQMQRQPGQFDNAKKHQLIAELDQLSTRYANLKYNIGSQ